MDNVIILPENAKRFNGLLVGNSAGVKNGRNHGTVAIAILAGAEFLFNDSENNHGLECEIIVIPKRKLHTAQTANGDRVKYGDILDKAEALKWPDAWVEDRPNMRIKKGGVQG